MGADKILENFEDLEALGDKHKTEIIETTKMEVFDLLKENMRPEFLNRIDDKIMFLPLSKDVYKRQIIRLDGSRISIEEEWSRFRKFTLIIAPSVLIIGLKIVWISSFIQMRSVFLEKVCFCILKSSASSISYSPAGN